MSTVTARLPIFEQLQQMVIGQDSALLKIVPFIETYQAGLNPSGRPAGNLLLCGNTGLGKTLTVEALATILHGSEKNLIKIDCGEFQNDHEVAKLIGAPPGYLGHRETTPMVTNMKLDAVRSEQCKLALVLFDEIEKAAPSMAKLLLGILDKGILRLGDSTSVTFEQTMVFMTTNLGARQLSDEVHDAMGFNHEERELSVRQAESIVDRAVKKHFSPEFMNRLDDTAIYHSFNDEDMEKIVSLEMRKFQIHLNTRLGAKTFPFGISDEVFYHILDSIHSRQYGARQLKRTIHKAVVLPIVRLINSQELKGGMSVVSDLVNDKIIVRTIDSLPEPGAHRFYDWENYVISTEQPRTSKRKTIRKKAA